METKAVSLQLGQIKGRDAIYLDSLYQSFSPNELTFKGEINGNLCSNKLYQSKWVKYEIRFINVMSFNCSHIESSIIEQQKFMRFSFEEVINLKKSDFNDDKGEYSHFLLATYSYIYQIKSESFEFKIMSERHLN